MTNVISIPSDDEDGAIAALETLATKFTSGVDALADTQYHPQIQFAFQIKNGPKRNEKKFFDRLVTESWSRAVPSLRKLILCYLDQIHGGEDGMPWHRCSPAIRAFVLLDPSPRDVWKLWIKKGDAEHDSYPVDKLYDEYMRGRSYGSLDDFAFCALMTLHRVNGGGDEEEELYCDSRGLIAVAERMNIEPKQFSEIVVAAFIDAFGEFASSDKGMIGSVEGVLLKALRNGNPYAKEVGRHFAQRLGV
ncbi:MAG: hypothetical protein HOO99_17130 [Hyphomicrobiaceae bacterium]|nr:hypothetical protein [Hyphomicrobiaceae bacterium]